MKRLLFVSLIIVALPVFGALENRNSLSRSPYVAFAGHTQSGGSCGCGDPGCITEPGECPRINSMVRQQRPGGDGAAVLLALFSLGLVLRLWLK